VDAANESHERRLVSARLRSITAALKIVGQRDKSRHASGRDGTAGDRPPCARGFTPGGTARTTCMYIHTRTPTSGLEFVPSSRNQSEVGTCLYNGNGLEMREAEEEEEEEE